VRNWYQMKQQTENTKKEIPITSLTGPQKRAYRRARERSSRKQQQKGQKAYRHTARQARIAAEDAAAKQRVLNNPDAPAAMKRNIIAAQEASK
jgi:hypothetical protein